MATLGEALDALAVIDALSGRTENPLAAAGFAKLTEASVNNIGQVTTTGWTTTTEKTKAGFKYTGTIKASKTEFAVLGTMAVIPGANGQIFEVGWNTASDFAGAWLERTAATTYKVTIETNAGSLISVSSKTWATGDRFALAYDEGKLKFMRKPSAGSWEEVTGKAISLTETPERPYWDFQPGTGSSSTVFRLTNFSAGELVFGTTFTETGEGTISVSGSDTEELVAAETATGTVTVTGEGTESLSITETAAGEIAVTGSGSEVLEFLESLSGTITVSGSFSETFEEATVTLILPQFPLSRKHPIYQPSYTGTLFALREPERAKEKIQTKHIAAVSGAATAIGVTLAAVGVIAPDVAIGSAGVGGLATLFGFWRKRR